MAIILSFLLFDWWLPLLAGSANMRSADQCAGSMSGITLSTPPSLPQEWRLLPKAQREVPFGT